MDVPAAPAVTSTNADPWASRATEPSDVAPLKKVTEPVGVPEPDWGATVAVNRTTTPGYTGGGQ
jgi:hypothetical protein